METHGLCYTYAEGTQALTDVDFRAENGEFVAMLASNGSGKTTLLRALTKLITPQRGRVLIQGRDIRHVAESELYQQVGLVLQNPADQLFAPTVYDDVAYGPRNLGLDEDAVRARADEALGAVDAAALAERAIHHLSFGEQKRVCLAGVLAMKPSILLLDEPTAGLDPAGEALMMHLLNRLNREQGITIVLATHSVDLLPLFADRITILNRGRLLKTGTPEEIFTDQEMVERSSLRLPYISRLLHELQSLDGVPVDGLPLTVREARLQLLELIPADLLFQEGKK
ncbi:ATP-binding cassette domain-containing protein [bacterium]|nr:ATP-binding cassette domain-containing protein [bacterium]